MPTIHSHAVVSSAAELGRNVVVGPFCVIEADTVIGEGCHLASHVVIKQGTTLGANNTICEGTVLGGFPQHVNVPECPGRLLIGANNTIREHCTFHRSLYENEATYIGNDNLLMVGVHIAHDCIIGDHAIFANGVHLAGHVVIEDKAYLSGCVGVHQFCRIGRLAMVGGHARVLKDIPPYVTIDGATGLVVGLNYVGLRRNKYSTAQVKELKAAYRVIYRSELNWQEIVPELQSQFPTGVAADFHQFLSEGTRGFAQERRTPPGATVRLHREAGADPSQERKAG